MLNWEFLLQKKGDESWLPLEAASVEILEGQYRLAARSSLRLAPITVSLQYYPFDSSHSPIQTSQVKNSNSDGLLIALTYTHLTAGIWQIGCSLGNSALAKLQFDVSPLSFDAEALDAASFESEIYKSEATDQPELNSGFDRGLNLVESKNQVEPDLTSIPTTAELLEPIETSTPNLADALQASEQAANQIFGEVSQLLADESKEKVLPHALLQLEQYQFVLEFGQILEISGTAEILADLEVTLNIPQEMRTVLKQKFPQRISLKGDRSPYSFNLEIELPPQNGVLVGTVQLIPADLSLDLNEHITYQAISVTFFPSSTDLAPDPLDQLPLNPSTQTRSVQTRSVQTRSVSLPSFSSPLGKFEELTNTASTEHLAEAEVLSNSLISSERPSDRLFDKLQQFFPTTDAYGSQLESLYQDIDQLLAEPMHKIESIPSTPSQPQPLVSPLTSTQIIQPLATQAQAGQAQILQSQVSQLLPQPPQIITALPRHQSLPVPTLQTETTEVTAGYPLVMMIELPAIANGFAVKLWAKDFQTRQMLDGPRWLMDFKPINGILQATTQITIPLGTLEVLFEAVTVELQSQRESYKAKLSLTVIPPNLDPNSNFSWLSA